ncbi:hypothetical protein QSH39_021455 [Xanthomonas arboricola pv. corylina]|uniref:hypothetical protein n=1 Tax=Xanthomonas TaxID=338 RepID=UPI001F2D6F07|nr:MULTISPECIES: hypothetical protein [Xanthomonas]MCE4343077.1 hypothetical protein [Xanthomonas hortorum pv. vitians]MDN0205429.1 hypothetical protein [Xanthomonas arboricola pv. corylina]MDN0218357.1 hypothetical protein [Xanthomonas arboricola pv. corylina]
MSGTEKIGEILSSNIPKEFLLLVESGFQGALERASAVGRNFQKGHRSTVVGVLRHYNLNEALSSAFAEAGLRHGGVKGNRIVFGVAGITTVARVHLNKGPWNNSRRSKAKQKLSERNVAAAKLVQPDLYEAEIAVPEITAFLITEGDGSPEQPAEIYIVVPNAVMDLKNPLFVETIGLFLQRYAKVDQLSDIAHPRLKLGVQINPRTSTSDESRD